MKNFLTFCAAILFTTASFAQEDAIDKFFTNYQDNKEFTFVSISPKMFQMFSKSTSQMEDQELKELIAGIKGLKVLSTKSDPNKYYTDALKRIPTKDYETLITVREKDQNIKFLTKSTGDVINELLLFVGGKDEFVMMSFIGNLDLNKISKLASKVNISGGEYLKKLDKK